MAKEIILDLPWDAIDPGKGLSIDIGGSVMKVLYLHKDDWVEPALRKEKSMGRLRLMNFAREVFDKAVSHVNTNCHIIRESPDETVQIFTTGIGGSQLKKTITSEFNLKTINIAEMDCFIQSLLYIINNIPREDILIDLHHPSYENSRKDIAKIAKHMSTGKEAKFELHEPRPYNTDRDKPLAAEDEFFPCMMMMCGSGFGGMKINKDGTFTLADGSMRGGRMFLGLGSLLTGAKTYEELMDLAVKGNSFNVGVSTAALSEGMDTDGVNPNSDEGNFHKKMAFFFGRAIGKTRGDFKNEDMARCLLEMAVQDLVHTAYSCSFSNNVKNVFFVGGFVNHPLVRQLVSEMWLIRDVNMALVLQKPIGQLPFHFLKHGSHLGALGAYLNSKLQFLSSAGKVTEEES